MEKYNIIPKPPSSVLTKVGKDKYYQISQMLMDEGMFKLGDEIAILALCTNYQRWLQAEKMIRDHKDLCYTASNGYRQQIAEISIANNAMKTMNTYIKELALTPKERIKLKAMVLAKDDNDDTDEEMEDMIQK